MFPNNDNFESKVSLESEKSGIVEDIPFRLLIIGDFTCDGVGQDLSLRRPIEIDRDNFDDVFAKFKIKIDLDIFGNGSDKISLQFNEIDDFHPDNIFRQIPLFADLRDVRRRLLNANTFISAANEVRSWFDSDETFATEIDTENSALIESDNLLDRILSGKSASEKPQTKHSKELNSLLKDLVRPHLVNVDEDEQSQLLSVVDESTSDLMRKILHNPRFQQIEATWRSLYFLVRRIETGADLKIYLLSATKEELSSNLKGCNNLKETFLYRRLISDVQETLGEDSWSLICGIYDFYPNIEDIATLIRLAKLGNFAKAPFISNMHSEVLGIKSIVESPNYEDWNFSEETSIGKLWTTLRSVQESEFLGLTLNKFLARLPFGSETDPIDTFAFEEFYNQPVHNQYLWANSAIICGLLISQSFRLYEWEMGKNLIQDIEGLPIHIYKNELETITTPCAETVLTQNSCEKLMEFGLMPLISYRNTDRVRLARFQSITSPVTALKGKWVKD